MTDKPRKKDLDQVVLNRQNMALKKHKVFVTFH